MASLVALRALVGASLGLGAADLLWLNVALAPDLVVSTPTPSQLVTPVPLRITPRVVAHDERPPSPAPEPEAVATPPDSRVVYFQTLSARLDGSARETLARLVEEAPDNAQLVLEGHADYRGDEQLNDRLSRDRANAVANYLVGLGMARTRLRIDHVGESGATAQLAETWRDRRVDIQITGGSR
jgi:outer membrane protein OmpA-like peptidoglycan-associated protein